MPQAKSVIGAIRPGRHLTRDARAVYIACRCSVDSSGAPNAYPWWVEDGKRGWSVDDAGRHLKNGTTPFDIVARVDATAGPNDGAEPHAPAVSAALERRLSYDQALIAAERERWKAAMALPHYYGGDCPDPDQPKARDHVHCAACRALVDLGA